MAISLTLLALMKARLHSRAESCHLPVSDVDTSKGRHSKWPAPPTPQCLTWVDELSGETPEMPRKAKIGDIRVEVLDIAPITVSLKIINLGCWG